MSRPRFSIAGLMFVVLLIAVGVAALRSASQLWAGMIFTLTLALLGVAVIGVIYRRGARRAFWLGATLFGGGYLIVSFGPWFATEVRPYLVTSALLDALDARMHPRQGGTVTVS